MTYSGIRSALLRIALVGVWGLCVPLANLDLRAEEKPHIDIYMPSPCLACIDWGAYLSDNGFVVSYRETADMAALKRRFKVPVDLESVPTGWVNGYFIEGHVPAEDIHLLLKEKPVALGLAVPGLPRGAPGRELSNPTCETACTMLEATDGPKEVRREMFDTLLVGKKGKRSTYARH